MNAVSLFARYVPRLVMEQPGGTAVFTVVGSLVFADVSGFTNLSERLAELGKAGAEELTAILNDRFTELLTQSFAEGGDLLKYGGDALLLLFRGEGHATRACRAAVRMRAALRDRGPIQTGRGKVTLRVSQGVHSGLFHCFLAGEHQRELILAGAEASQVTEMETAADAGEVLVSPATAALLPRSCRGQVKGPGVLLRGQPAGVPVPAALPASVHAEPAERFVPAPVRARIASGVEDAEHRYATIGFIHVFGLDDLVATVPPPEVAGRLDRLVRVTEAAAAEAGVCLISTDIAGDGTKLILSAGAPDAVEDGEGRMLGVVRAVLDGVDDLGLHAGVNAGHIFAGEVGAPFRGVYTVIGDAVNLAARLMSKAGHGQLLAERTTFDRAAVAFVGEPLEPFMVKGKSRPIDALVVGERLGPKERRNAFNIPFTGRERELAHLGEALATAAGEGRGACVVIAAPAGIGKSRLVEHVLSTQPDVPVTRVTCEPVLAERPYFVARLVLRRALGVSLDADRAEAGRQLLRVLAEHTADRLPLAPLLAVAVDADVPPTPEASQITPANRPRMIAEVAADVVGRLVTRPTALVIEDAEWTDEASTAVLARVLQGAVRHPWFVACTCRDAQRGLPHALAASAQVLRLDPLDDTTIAALASRLVGDAAVPAHDLDVLCARAAGNPLFLTELVTARLSAGSVDDVPSSLEDLITSRIDRLDPADRRALRFFSVLGDRFPVSTAVLAFAEVLPDVHDPGLWERLSEFLVVERRGDRRFAFDIVRHVAYEGLPYLRRRELHERVGLALEGAAQGSATEDRISLLSLHFDQARDHQRAWDYSRRAGADALAKYANQEAATFLERAIHHGRAEHTASDVELAEVAEQFADASAVVGRYDRASWGYGIARSLRRADIESAPRLLRKEGVIRERSGRYRSALGWYRRAMRTAELLPESDRSFEEAELAVAYAGVRLRQGQLADCVRWCRTALEHSERSGNRRARAHAYYLMDAALTDLGDPEADAVRGLALPVFEELGDLHGQANVLINLGVDAQLEGHWDDAARWWRRCGEVAQRAGDVIRLADVGNNLGGMYSDQGRFEEAEGLIREARRIWRAAQYPMGVGAATNGLGRLAVRAGRVDEGIVLLREALAIFQNLAAATWIWESEVWLAEALLYAGRWHEAVQQAQHALDDYDLASAAHLHSMALRVRGVARWALEEHEAALEDLTAAIAVAVDSRSVFEEALARQERARRTTGDAAQADAECAAAILTRLGVDAERIASPTLVA